MPATKCRIAARERAHQLLEAALADAGNAGITTRQAAAAASLGYHMAAYQLRRCAFALRASTKCVKWARWYHILHADAAKAYVQARNADRPKIHWSEATASNAVALLLRAGPSGIMLDDICSAMGKHRNILKSLLTQLRRNGLCVTTHDSRLRKTYYAPQHAPAPNAAYVAHTKARQPPNGDGKRAAPSDTAATLRSAPKRADAHICARHTRAEVSSAASEVRHPAEVVYMPGWTYTVAPPFVDRRFEPEVREAFFAAGKLLASESAVARAYGGRQNA